MSVMRATHTHTHTHTPDQTGRGQHDKVQD